MAKNSFPSAGWQIEALQEKNEFLTIEQLKKLFEHGKVTSDTALIHPQEPKLRTRVADLLRVSGSPSSTLLLDALTTRNRRAHSQNHPLAHHPGDGVTMNEESPDHSNHKIWVAAIVLFSLVIFGVYEGIQKLGSRPAETPPSWTGTGASVVTPAPSTSAATAPTSANSGTNTPSTVAPDSVSNHPAHSLSGPAHAVGGPARAMNHGLKSGVNEGEPAPPPARDPEVPPPSAENNGENPDRSPDSLPLILEENRPPDGEAPPPTNPSEEQSP